MLDEILNQVRDSLERLRPREPDLRAAAQQMPPARDFVGALTSPGLAVIAEFKRASPSRGIIDAAMDPAERARLYQSGGAAALSVLTEPHFFMGSAQDLQQARQAVSLPVLRKDFILEPVQIWEARAMGADAVLLIMAVLDDQQLRVLLQTARQAGVAALVEVHNRSEVERLPPREVQVVGVNNRDLHTFQVDLATAEQLAPWIDAEAKVAESGIHGPPDAARLAAAGYDALLVGEYLTRAKQPSQALAGLRGVG